MDMVTMQTVISFLYRGSAAANTTLWQGGAASEYQNPCGQCSA